MTTTPETCRCECEECLALRAAEDVAIFEAAMPSSTLPMSPSSFTHSRCSAWALNFVHVARPTACFNRCRPLLPSGPTTSSAASRRRPSGPSRTQIRLQICPFTSPRTLDSIASSVENASSSKPACVSRSNATLIRSGG